MDRKTKGKIGEEMAESHLQAHGYEILERNFRHGHGEIDIIALQQDKLLVFIEVKLRKDATYGDPETFVSVAQQRSIMSTADHYIHAINWQRDIRFDIITINTDQGKLDHIEDAFY